MERIIRMNQLINILGLSRSTIYRLRKEGMFVPHIQLGPRSVGYSEKAISAWLEARALPTHK